MTKVTPRSRAWPLGTRALGLTILGPLLVCNVAAAHGQKVIGVSRRAAELGFDFRSRWNSFATGSLNNDAGYGQWLRLPFSGALFGPRVLRYSFTLRPAFRQATSNQVSSTVVSRRLDLDFSSRLFPYHPVSLALAAGRSGGSSHGGGHGISSNFTTAYLNGEVSLRYSPFPLRLSYHARSTEQEWQTGPVIGPVARSDNRHRLKLTGQSSKTSFSVERITSDDRRGANNFVSWVGNLAHKFRWGKGSSLNSSFDYADRSGEMSPFRRFSWRERVRLQHSSKVSSDYFYSQRVADLGSSESHGRSYGTGVSVRANRWLSMRMRAVQQSTTFSEVTSSIQRIAPSMNLNLPLPRWVQLTLGAGLGYERRKQKSEGARVVPVVSERHRVADFRTFALDNTSVDTATVVLRSSDLLIAYARGLDYELFQTGAVTQVQILPLSRIEPGAVVVASYRFSAAPQRRAETLTANYNANLNLGGFNLRHRQSFRTTGSVTDALLTIPDFNQMSTHLRTVRRTPLGRLRLDAERRSRSSDRFDNTMYEVRMSLGLPATRRVQTSIGGHWSKTVGGEQGVTAVSLNSSISWTAASNLRVFGRAEGFNLTRRDNGFERFLGASVDVQWSIASLQTVFRYEHQRRDVGIDGSMNRISARVVRRF